MIPVIPDQPKRLDSEDDDDIFIDVETVDVEEGSFPANVLAMKAAPLNNKGKKTMRPAVLQDPERDPGDIEGLDIEEGSFSRKRSRDDSSIFEEQGKEDIEEGGPSRSRKRSRDEESVFEEQWTGDIEEGSPSPKRSRNEHGISEEQEKKDMEDGVPSYSVCPRKRPRDEASIVEEIEKTHSKNGAPPLKRSRVGRSIVVPRRFRDEPEGWSRHH